MSSAQPTSAPSSPPSAAGEGRPEPPRRFSCCGLPVGCAWLVTAIGFAVLLSPPAYITCAQWEQPNTINYESNDPYILYVKENSSWWNVFNRNRHCRVGVVSHVHGDLLYGHWTEYEFHNYSNDSDYFTRCVVTWEPEGVTITESTGHKLFIPKNAFIGGR